MSTGLGDTATSRAGWFGTGPLPESVRGVADDLDVEQLIDVVLERCVSTVFASHAHDDLFVAQLRASASENAYALRDVIAGRRSLGELHFEQVLEFATVQARLRIPQMSMQRSYRVSFLTQWEAWTAHLVARLDDTDLPASDAIAATTQLTRIILGYQDYVASKVAETYTRDYETLNRSRAHVRKSLVREVLRGELGNLSASDLAILAYPLEGHHVAILLPQMPEGAATQLAKGLRSRTKAHEALVYPLTLGSTVVWLCRLEPWRQPLLAALVEMLEQVGASASVSNPGAGADGFREALAQAEETERVRAAWGARGDRPVMRYADAGLEILLLQDTRLARKFVDAELGPLAADTVEAARLRETLEASFRHGSHVAAAVQLKLHEHTVRNRLHRAEELLGHSLQERPTELQVAVRLVRLLQSEV